jgi:hypothetical protein
LLMRPLLLHESRRSLSPKHRRIVHLEYAPKAELHPDLSWYSGSHSIACGADGSSCRGEVSSNQLEAD